MKYEKLTYKTSKWISIQYKFKSKKVSFGKSNYFQNDALNLRMFTHNAILSKPDANI